jgi:hypothetical protein
MKKLLSTGFDGVGATTSALCIVHCLGTAALGVLLPAWGVSFLSDERIHHALALVVIVAGLLAFVPGMRLHHNWFVAIFAALGLTAIALSQVPPEHGSIETPLTVFGGGMLVIAHWQNRALCRECRRRDCQPRQ